MLKAGHTLAHYEIVEPIGKGGMGEVYRARDGKLGRDVAIKVLPDAFAQDGERLARFKREAKVLASLNHPNIASIYGLEQSESTHYLVLELVPGETLAERISRGPIPLEEVLDIATQMAEALEEAHERGIVHRDLKPANVKQTEDGKIKVLDFGLAKVFQEETPDADSSMSPTFTRLRQGSGGQTRDATRLGVILGTAAYMSPEQAKGKRVDKRADVWAFGVVLYEMLTGKRAFAGEDVSDTLAYVLTKEPQWDALPAEISPTLGAFLRRSLEKDPKRRVRDIGDVRLAVDGAFDTTTRLVSTDDPRATAVHVWQRPVPLAAAALAVAVSSLAVWGVVRPVETPASPTRFPIVGPANVDLALVPHLSPDGRTVAFLGVTSSSQLQVYTRALDELEAVPLRGAEGGIPVDFSPDSQSLLFIARAPDRTLMLKKVPVTGGPALALSEARFESGRWGPGDRVVMGSLHAGLSIVPAAGGESMPLTTLGEDEIAHLSPEVLPDGHTVLFHILFEGGVETAQIAVYTDDTDEPRILLPGMTPRVTTSGHLVFWRASSLWAVPFDSDRLEIHGEPVPVVEGVSASPGGQYAAFDVARSGALVYNPSGARPSESIVWVDRAGQVDPLPGLALGRVRDVSISPDGTRLAVTVDDEDQDLWTYDVARGVASRLTTDPAPDHNPVWTPDGRRIIFTSERNGVQELFSRAADGTGEAELLLTRADQSFLWAEGWTPDGTRLLFVEGDVDGQSDIGLLSLEGDPLAETLLDTDFNVSAPAVSPDGGWMAYHADVSGRFEVYVERFPNLGDRQQISTDGGRHPKWSPDGLELFYRSIRGNKLLAVAIDPGPPFRAGAPRELFAGRFRSSGGVSRPFDVAPDGERFLMVTRISQSANESEAPQIIFVENWLEELKRLVPTDN